MMLIGLYIIGFIDLIIAKSDRNGLIPIKIISAPFGRAYIKEVHQKSYTIKKKRQLLFIELGIIPFW